MNNNDKKLVGNTTICQNARAEEVSGLHDTNNKKSTAIQNQLKTQRLIANMKIMPMKFFFLDV